MPDAASLEVEETDPTDLDALAPEWLALWRRTPAATPFQAPAWLLPWWRRFGDGEPCILALRAQGRLVGIAPFYVRHEPEGRKLLPLGIGLGDYLDPLLDPAQAGAAATAIIAHLHRMAHRFDWCDLEGQRAGSPLLLAPAPEGWADVIGAREPCPVLALPAAGGELCPEARSRVGRLSYYLRRAERLGETRIERAEAGNAEELLEALIGLHAARWESRGEPGVLADPAVQAFHRDAVPRLLAAGTLRLYGLRIGGRIAAVLYGLADRTRFCAYIGGFDPALPHPGLGGLMLAHAVREAMAEGLRELDFLRGREPYKYAWGAVDQPSYGRRLTPAS